MQIKLTPRTRIMATALGLAAALLVLSATVGSFPGVCASCHAMKPFAAELEASAHAEVSCYDCHLTAGAWDWPQFKATELARMYPRGILGGELTGPVTRTGASPCIRCHEDVLMGTVSAQGLRINHGVCAAGGSCDNCHSTVAHGSAVRWAREPVMEDCAACHAEAGASVACDLCHDGRIESDRLAAGPWQITHGPAWETTHGMGNLASCATCHPADYCVRCHQISLPHPIDFPSRHGADAIEAPGSCETCHDRAALCDTCHGMEMPHPGSFLKEHGSLATSFTDGRCTGCHYESDCQTCHETHVHPGASDGTINTPLPKAGGDS